MYLTRVGQAMCALGLAGMLSLGTAWAEPAVDHTAWDTLLRRYVKEGRVDYRGVQQARNVLDQYLAQLQNADPETLPSKEAKLAFWANAYNACVFTGVLSAYPLKSVRDIKGFFDTIRYPVGGASLTLNEIEAKGRAFGDWRIHFAVVCASSSCPFLRSEAYVPERLDAQLTEQVRKFVGDAARGVRFEEARGVLWVSKIFKWYLADFVPNARQLTASNLSPVLSPYLDAHVADAIRQRNPAIKLLDYDWTLNDMAQPEASVK